MKSNFWRSFGESDYSFCVHAQCREWFESFPESLSLQNWWTCNQVHSSFIMNLNTFVYSRQTVVALFGQDGLHRGGNRRWSLALGGSCAQLCCNICLCKTSIHHWEQTNTTASSTLFASTSTKLKSSFRRPGQSRTSVNSMRKLSEKAVCSRSVHPWGQMEIPEPFRGPRFSRTEKKDLKHYEVPDNGNWIATQKCSFHTKQGIRNRKLSRCRESIHK